MFDNLIPELPEPENPLFQPEPEPEKPKRGRKKGQTVATKPTKKDVDLSIAVNTVGALLAGMLGRPDLALSKEETDGIATAANRVASYYELPDMGVVGAWVNLGLTIGAIVYPRYAIIKAEKAERKEKEAKDVTDNAI